MCLLFSDFASVFSEISKAIDDADFLAIDGEFTGLTSFKQHHCSVHMTSGI